MILFTCLFAALTLSVTTDKPQSVCSVGEVVEFSVRSEEHGSVAYRLTNNGSLVYEEGVKVLRAGESFKVKGVSLEPGFLWLEARDAEESVTPPVRRGVACNPEKILPASPEPADFDEFWSKAIAHDASAAKSISVEKVGEDGYHNLYQVKIPTVHGRTLYGYLSEPKDCSKGPFETLVSVPGAGPSSVGAAPEKKDQIHFRVNVHYYDPSSVAGVADKAEAKRIREGLQSVEDAEWNLKYPSLGHRLYSTAGIAASREEYFYYDFILGMNRAIDWLAKRPTVDRRRMYYSAGSQGGGLGLILLALNSNLAFGRVDVPAMADSVGFKAAGRQSGWPHLVEKQLPENRAVAAKNAPYFDSANFARRIRKPVVMTIGLCDPTCPPHTCFAAYNVIPSRDKTLLMGKDMGHIVDSEIDAAAKRVLARMLSESVQ